MPADPASLERTVRHLAAIDRPSASEGERVAAGWIAERLRERGCDARIEEERAHGGYWWPLGILTGAAAVAGLAARGGGRAGRALAALVGGVSAAAVYDDVGGGKLWFRRAALPHRSTWNVVAEAGDRAATDTIVLVAHHDAAHSGLVFHPAVPAFFGDRFPGLLERARTSPPVIRAVFAGPALVAAGALTGSRRLLGLGTRLSALVAALLTDIGLRDTVPGANDNLTGVAVIVDLARILEAEPVEGVRVILVSTGSEESFMEGMQGFARRHFPALSPAHTRFVAVETVGSPELVIAECEGMVVHRDYDAELKDLLESCADEAGVHVRRGLRFSFATDALMPLRAGYPSAMIGSVNRYKAPDNYHWPTDTADNVEFSSVADAVAVCEALVRRLAREGAASAAAPDPAGVSA